MDDTLGIWVVSFSMVFCAGWKTIRRLMPISVMEANTNVALLRRCLRRERSSDTITHITKSSMAHRHHVGSADGLCA